MRTYVNDFLHSLGMLVAVMLIGAIVVRCFEAFSWLDSFYWAAVTASAVGFGDETLGNASRAFGIVYLPIAVVCLASTVRRPPVRSRPRPPRESWQS
eukprot:4206937-Prymnesium_polylepis.1